MKIKVSSTGGEIASGSWKGEITESGLRLTRAGSEPVVIEPGEGVAHLGGRRVAVKRPGRQLVVEFTGYLSYRQRLARAIAGWLSGAGEAPRPETFRVEPALQALVYLPAIIPVLTRGGAIQGAIAGGLIVGLYALVQNERLSVAVKALMCVTLAAGGLGLAVWLRGGFGPPDDEGSRKTGVSGPFRYRIHRDEVTLYEYVLPSERDGAGVSVDVPGEIKRRPVVVLSKGLFSGQPIVAVRIPDGVEAIGVDAFSGCERLAEVRLPPKLNRIEGGTFSGCSVLKEVSIPGTVTVIDYRAFLLCESLRAIELPAGLKSLGQNAFGACVALEEVVLPDAVNTIGAACFERCGALRSVRLPARMAAIPERMFASCENLDGIELPPTLLSIGPFAFENCHKLEAVRVPPKVVHIEHGAFSGCQGLKEVALPDSLEWIGAKAFQHCRSLESVTIPASVRAIGAGAFANCRNLREVRLLGEPGTIADDAFEGVAPDFQLVREAVEAPR